MDSNLWKTDNFSIFRIVKKRKYLIQKNQNQLFIQRKKLDIFDTIGMGSEHMKLSAFAKGSIHENDINLEISIKPFYKKLTIVIFSILYLLSILSFIKDWKFGFFLGVGITVFLIFYAIIWNEIIENFTYELESDIQHFNHEVGHQTKRRDQF